MSLALLYAFECRCFSRANPTGAPTIVPVEAPDGDEAARLARERLMLKTGGDWVVIGVEGGQPARGAAPLPPGTRIGLDETRHLSPIAEASIVDLLMGGAAPEPSYARRSAKPPPTEDELKSAAQEVLAELNADELHQARVAEQAIT